MKRKIRFSCLLVLIIPFCSGCASSKLSYERVVYPNGKEEINKERTIESLIPNGQEMSILPAKWMEFRNNAHAVNDIDQYRIQYEELSKPEPVVINWTNKNETSKYSFLIADNKYMKDYKSYDIDSVSFEAKDLFANKQYYYQIKAQYDEYYVISKRYDFKTVDYFRTLDIDGVLNCRDLGNKRTIDGKKRVKQGVIYRSAGLDNITEQGKKEATEKYGIKTDLDLREKGTTGSPIGLNINYINNGVGRYGSPYYCNLSAGVQLDYYQTAMRDNLKVLTDVNNFPLVFHCSVGRDRTGTFAITLLLILGIDLYQIKEDYAVSFFSKSCNSYEFEDFEDSLEELFNYYESFVGDDGVDSGNIFKRVEKYCYHIGLSKQDLKYIRKNLLERA